MVSLYGPPNEWFLEASSNTLWSCKKLGDDGLVVVDVNEIEAVVAMVLHRPRIPGREVEDRYYVCEKMGLDVAEMGGWRDDGEADNMPEGMQRMEP
jgi:hypothetical protein